MEKLTSFEQFTERLQQDSPFLLFVKAENCSVCEGLYPQIEALRTDYSYPFYLVNVSETPAFAGQLSLFTAPVVLLFTGGKEYARFARFVQMEGLRKRMGELTKWGESND